MGQVAALGVLGVGQKRTSGCVGVVQGVGVPGGQAGGLHLFEQLALAQAGVELKVRSQGQRQARAAVLSADLAQAVFKGLRHACAGQQLGGGDAVDPVGQLVVRAFGQVDHALRDTQPRQATAGLFALVHGQQQGFGFFAQQLAVGQRARGDHTHHLALHRTFGSGDVSNLLANGDRFAQLDQACQIALDRVERHARHDDGLPRRLAAFGDGDVEQAACLFGVLPEQLVKVAHPVEDERVGKLRLDGQVLGHHGGVGAQVRRGRHGVCGAVRTARRRRFRRGLRIRVPERLSIRRA